VCTLGTREDWFSAKGTIDGVYDPTMRTFDDATMDVQEPPGLLDSFGLGIRSGGVGTWRAALDPDAVPPEPVNDCLDGAPWMDFDLVPR
jgi:hypothetical protein